MIMESAGFGNPQNHDYSMSDYEINLLTEIAIIPNLAVYFLRFLPRDAATPRCWFLIITIT